MSAPKAFLVAAFLAAGAALAWNPPPPEVDPPQTPDDAKHARLSPRGHFQHHAHSFIIERAARILASEGHANWASSISQYHQHLLDGAMYPDRYGAPMYTKVTLRVLGFKAKQWSFHLCNAASLEHYYNPDTGKGLRLAYWQDLERLAKLEAPILSWLGAGLIGLDGLVFATVDVDPDFREEYPPATARCQEFFDKALDAWRGKLPPEPGRGRDETAMFYLGAACHYLADMVMVDHTYDCFAGEHEAYEDHADGKGDDDAYHASSGVVCDAAAPIAQFAARHAEALAKAVHNIPHFERVEGQGASPQPGQDLQRRIKGHGPTDWDVALKVALPLAERYTAGLVARFFAELNVPGTTPALAGTVRDSTGNPLPGAYVFYRFLYGQHAPWEFIRADSQGKYRLLAPYSDIELRPAMPGYDWEGKHVLSAQLAPEAFATKSPVPYAYKQFGKVGDTIDFYLKPLPVEAVLCGLLDFSTARMMVARTASLAPQDIAARQVFLRPPPLALRAPLEPEEALPKSNTPVGPELADGVCRALLSVREVSDRVLRSENSNNWFPPSAQVLIQLSHLVDLTSGKKVSDSAQLAAALDVARLQLADAFPAKPLAGIRRPAVQPTPDKNLLQAMKLLDDLLPQPALPGPDGQAVPTVVLPGLRSEPGIGDNLLAHGLVPVPSTAGVALEAQIVPSPGYLGSVLTPPLSLTTNKDGQVAFELVAGTHAGRVRVAVRVTNDPLVKYPPPSLTLEFLVLPRAESDVSPLKHPVLKSLMPIEERWAGHPLKPVEPRPTPVAPELTEPKAPKPKVTVEVVESDGRSGFIPVPGAEVEIIDEQDMPVPGAAGRSSAAGTLEVKALPPGGYAAVVTKDGYRKEGVDFQMGYRDLVHRVVLTRHGPRAEARLALRIVERGRRRDLAPVPGARIAVVLGTEQAAAGLSAADGRFTTGLLVPGTYQVFVAKDGYQRGDVDVEVAERDISRDIVLERAAGEPAVPVEPKPLQLRLVVVVREGAGAQARPVSGASVALSQGGQRIGAGQSDADGMFAFTVAPGAYRVEVRAEGFWPAAADATLADRDAACHVTLARGIIARPPLEPKQPAIVPPPPLPPPPPPPVQYVLRLEVLDRNTRKGVPGAQIVLTQNRVRAAAGEANQDGRYVVRLRPGAYQLDATKDGYHPGRTQVVVADRDVLVELPLDSAIVRPVEIIPGVIVQPNVRLRVIEAPGGQPLPGAQIAISQQGKHIAAGTADQQGRYALTLGAETYRLNVSRAPSHVPTQLDIVVGNQPLERDIPLAKVRID